MKSTLLIVLFVINCLFSFAQRDSIEGYGSLMVESTPSVAKVYLDGKKVGNTPVIVGNLDMGTYTLIIERDNYVPYQQKIVFDTDTTIIRKVNLQKMNDFVRHPVKVRQHRRTRKPRDAWNDGTFSVSGIADIPLMGGLNVAYLNKFGIYFSTSLDLKHYWMLGGGFSIRNRMYNDGKSALHTYFGGGTDAMSDGYYYEIGELFDLGALTLQIGLGNMHLKNHSLFYKNEYQDKLFLQIGVGTNF